MGAHSPGIRITLVAVRLACAALATGGCGKRSAKADQASDEPPAAATPAARTFPDDPAAWTCSDFEDAPAERYQAAVNELIAANQLKGRRAELERQIRAICAQSSPEYKPAVQAVDKTAGSSPPALDQGQSGEPGASGESPSGSSGGSSESGSSGSSGSGGGSAEPPADPQRSPGTQPSEPSRSPPCGPNEGGYYTPSGTPVCPYPNGEGNPDIP